MLTSVFSHASFAHLAFNSIALISFAPSVAKLLHTFHDNGQYGHVLQSTINPHFLAFFIAAGCFSAWVSHFAQAIRVRHIFRNLARPEKATAAIAAASQIKPSLGASGAIYAMVVLTSISLPYTSVNILFIPVAIPIGAAVSGMVALDVLGIIRGWQMFDHWAHLGGALFGLWAWWDQARLWGGMAEAAEEVIEEDILRQMKEEEANDDKKAKKKV
ncbi:hypothetical protein FRB99_002574 [Tulasnella sp. 403]|nr:hypothetical protein FRB99_002574 [Tulasnella sp. 403]